MSLGYILQKVGADCGIDITDADTRAYLTSKVNEACDEIYRHKDLPVILEEVFVRVGSNKEMSLPPFVEELRAIRSGCTDYCTPRWELRTQWPKYNRTEWANQWNGWRDKGSSPIAIDYDDTSPGTIEYPEIDENLVVTIVGETENSNNYVNNITMDATSKPWTSNFTKIKTISKNKATDFNVVIKNAAGDEMSIIYANQLTARYKIVDISKYPQNLWGCCSCGDGTYIMEVLYKPRRPILINDADVFPVDGYDNAIVIKTKQLLAELEVGQEQRAILMNEKAKYLINDVAGDKQNPINKKICMKKSPFFINWDFIPYDRVSNPFRT